MKAALALLVMILGLGFAFNTASCSAQNACTTSSGGTGGSSGTAGASGTNCVTGASATAGSGGATTCDTLTALQACLSAFCASDGAGTGTPFCTCYSRGFDLSGNTDPDPANQCICIDFHPDQFCADAALTGATAADYSDCSSVTSPLISMCVPVQ